MVDFEHLNIVIVLSIALCLFLPESSDADCWETGCHLSTWYVVGCEQYGRKEIARRPCQGGNHYTCCTIENGGGKPPQPSNNNCWETGCHISTWDVVGCQQYGRKEIARRPCQGGNHYTCCAIENGGEKPPKPSNADCWETGCHISTWDVVGCQQYGRKEIARRPCQGGNHYTCCATENPGNGQSGGDPGNGKSPPKGTKQGDMTYYYPSKGACGKISNQNDMIVAVSGKLFTTPNPNLDPICGKRIKITDPTSKRSVEVTIVDMCPECAIGDVDVTPAAFLKLRPLVVGRFKVQWDFI